MNTKQMIVALCLSVFTVLFAKAAPQDKFSSAQLKESNTLAQSQPQHQDNGARIFHQNCSRCHNTPEGFSPRISGTVVKHMRVRASLSAEDERELLRFLNP